MQSSSYWNMSAWGMRRQMGYYGILCILVFCARKRDFSMFLHSKTRAVLHKRKMQKHPCCSEFWHTPSILLGFGGKPLLPLSVIYKDHPFLPLKWEQTSEQDREDMEKALRTLYCVAPPLPTPSASTELQLPVCIVGKVWVKTLHLIRENHSVWE